MSKNLLIIFTRNPELGKVKTRLAKTIGNQAALSIYTFLLNHTQTITKEISATKQVYYSEEIWEDDVWDSSIFEKKLQSGSDLGERMHKAIKKGFDDGFTNIVLIGSDMYDISQADIEHAFSCLKNNNFVIGPAEDGGYYLIGMNKLHPTVFTNITWGTHTVLDKTLEHLKNESFTLVSLKNDIDTYEDLKDIAVFQPYLK